MFLILLSAIWNYPIWNRSTSLGCVLLRAGKKLFANYSEPIFSESLIAKILFFSILFPKMQVYIEILPYTTTDPNYRQLFHLSNGNVCFFSCLFCFCISVVRKLYNSIYLIKSRCIGRWPYAKERNNIFAEYEGKKIKERNKIGTHR